MEYELYHAGVKGMKWGVRKAKPQASGTRPGNAKADQKVAKKRLTTGQKVAIGAAIAGTALAAVGAYKLAKIYGPKLRAKYYTNPQSKVKDMLKSTKSLSDARKRVTSSDWDRKYRSLNVANPGEYTLTGSRKALSDMWSRVSAANRRS